MKLISRILSFLKIEIATSIVMVDSMNDVNKLSRGSSDDYHRQLNDQYYRNQSSFNLSNHHRSSHYFNQNSYNSFNSFNRY